MRKYITPGLIALIASYSIAGQAGIPAPAPAPSPATSSAFNFTSNDPNIGGRGPGGLAASLNKIFFGGPNLSFDQNGILVDASGKPFTGTTATGEVFKDGKKQ